MNLNALFALLAMGMPPPPGTKQDPTGEMLKMFGMLVIMGFVMYWLMIRPQRQREKRLQELLKSLKPGDKVLTGSGIVGVVISVKEKTLTLRSADTKLEVLKSAVSEVTERAGEAAAS